MCILSEPVRPLREEYTSLTADEIICGLSHLCEALSFLHDRCALSHESISLDSIFISVSNHSWKLGSLQNVTPIKITPGTDRYHAYQEDMKRLAEIFRILLGMQRPATTGGSCALPSFITSLESSQPNGRPQAVRDWLQDQLFRDCDYLQIVKFIENFASFSDAEILSFFQTIVSRLRSLPLEVLSQKLVPLILTSRFVMLHPSAGQHLLPYLFTCVPTSSVEEPLLNVKLFKTHILPLIRKLYCVKKVQIRLVLLHYLPEYARFFELPTLKEHLLPQIWLAEKDENDELVAATYNAIGQLVRIYGSAAILGERKRLFSQIIPRAAHRNDSLDSLPNNDERNCPSDESNRAGDATADSSMTEEQLPTKPNKNPEQNLTFEMTSNGSKTSKEELEEKSSCSATSPQTNNQIAQPATKTLRIMSLSQIGDSRKGSSNNSSTSLDNGSSLVNGLVMTKESNGLTSNGSNQLSNNLKNGNSHNQTIKVSSADLESDIKALKIKPIMDGIEELFSDMKPKLQFKQSQQIPVRKKTRERNSRDMSAKFSVNCLENDTSTAGWGIDDGDEVDLSNLDTGTCLN